MPAPDIISSLALALGILAIVGGASCLLASVVMLAPTKPISVEPPRQIDLLEILGDFVLVLMDLIPFFSLFRSARDLPETARMMRAKWVNEPIIRHFFFTGLSLAICGGVILTFGRS